jgi:hypothetical protein
VRFQVLTAATLKMTAFWVIAPYVVEVDRCFRGAYYLRLLCTFGTSVNLYETARRNNPESCHLDWVSFTSVACGLCSKLQSYSRCGNFSIAEKGKGVMIVVKPHLMKICHLGYFRIHMTDTDGYYGNAASVYFFSTRK